MRGWPHGDQADCGGGRHGKEHGGTDGQSVWLGQDGPRGGLGDGIDGIDGIDVRPVRPQNWESGQADKGKLYFIQLNDGSIPLDIQADFLLYCCVYMVRLLGYVGLLL